MKAFLKFSMILWGITFSTSGNPDQMEGDPKLKTRYAGMKITQTCDGHTQSLALS